MSAISYNRDQAIAYAHTWALSRNPVYLDFSNLGGDCTNFVSQCLFAGIGVMDYTPGTGWYYTDGNRKSPSWTGVSYLRQFLLSDPDIGPYAAETTRQELLPGDIIQLMNPLGHYYHSLFVLQVTSEEVYIAAHTNDAYLRPLSSYSFQLASYLKILGGRR